eukprot:TRINITY_DN10689_c0_g1_i1.p1 TRINITY_DN10689_c0_g1~~TRINITY_DN10689_c0_g1_i1.p1  ORF type:complete len:557 (+),score=80.17 TRINITY_DN10689_c0_g1_i1:381-2051(+)
MFLSLSGRRNMWAMTKERAYKLVAVSIFGVFFLAVPTNYFIAQLNPKQPYTGGFFAFLIEARAYDPGHFLFLPYLFLITTAFLPHFAYIARIREIVASPHHTRTSTASSSTITSHTPASGNDTETVLADEEEAAPVVVFLQQSTEAAVKPRILAGFLAAYAVGLAAMAASPLLTGDLSSATYADTWWLLLVLAFVSLSALALTLRHAALIAHKLSLVSAPLLFIVGSIPVFVVWFDIHGRPFFLHPLGLSVIYLALLLVPLLPVNVKLNFTRWLNFGVNVPIAAMVCVALGQLFCLGYPAQLTRNEEPPIDMNFLTLYITDFLSIPAKFAASTAYMIVGHATMFIVGFLWMAYEQELPDLPRGVPAIVFVCITVLLVIVPHVATSRPEGWTFLSAGYVAVDKPRRRRLLYGVGSWLWCLACMHFAKLGTNDFPQRPWLRWIRDRSFGLFFCHVLCEAVVAWILQTYLDDMDWYYKIAALNVSVFALSYLWCGVVAATPVLRVLCGMKKLGRGQDTIESRMIQAVKLRFGSRSVNNASASNHSNSGNTQHQEEERSK